MSLSKQRGFTLPELLVASGVFVVLVIVAFVLVHPKDYGPERRDAARQESVAFIAQGLNRYVAQYGVLPGGITSEPQLIGSEAGMLDLCLLLVPEFLPALPYDPRESAATDTDCTAEGVAYITGYALHKSDANTVVISAPGSELDIIEISRTY